ncbi:MAG TPA: Nramp family divalent metal transporter [Candidatus Sulfotelmatobacter sp.]|jgi:NRAMP (natural resistance-associated macrophage protein)-like metal ion transporter|nr:Nramp family divalent metal transporter [Candidatus Sulfotelmatobacter sp.]
MEEKIEEVVHAPVVALEKGFDISKKFSENMESDIQKFAEAPAIALEKGIAMGEKAVALSQVKHAKSYWALLGPGLVTGAADDDPSGIATYSQTGAQYGFQLLWLALFTFPLMAIVQEMCARIGLTTGRGLAGNIRIHYPKWVLYICAILLFAANTLNIGADIGAMAKAVQLFFPTGNFVILTIFFTFFILLIQVYTPYEQYAKYLKYLVLVLFSYVATALIVHLDPAKLLYYAVVPSITFSKNQIFLITGILGTTISPYLFFWQTSHEVEEDILHGKTSIRLRQENVTKKEIKNMRIDVWSGMFLSNLVMFAIVATCAAVLFAHGITNINSASDAAAALKPLAGKYAFILFGIGIIGMGLLAIPTLAGSAAYTVAESFRWKQGLYRKLKEARAFYGVIILSMLLGLSLNFLGIDPIKMLIYSAVGNGLVAPVILFFIVRLASSKKVVKERVNHPMITLVGWITTGFMGIAGIATIISLFMS